MKPTLILLTALLLAPLQALAARTAVAPFPDALTAADVTITNAVKISDELVVGNGEMNAIVYVAGKDLMLRVSKNDVWDGRIDTSEDPALPKPVAVRYAWESWPTVSLFDEHGLPASPFRTDDWEN